MEITHSQARITLSNQLLHIGDTTSYSPLTYLIFTMFRHPCPFSLINLVFLLFKTEVDRFLGRGHARALAIFGFALGLFLLALPIS